MPLFAAPSQPRCACLANVVVVVGVGRKEGRKEGSWMEETYLPSGGQEVPPFGEMSRERAGEMRVARVHSVSGLAAIVALSAGINSGMSL